MLQAYGLKTHIWNNNLRSILLLILFPILLLCLAYALILIWVGMTHNGSVLDGAIYTVQIMPRYIPIVIAGSLVWFSIAFFGHQAMIDHATQARSVSAQEEPKAYRLLENLCIARGIVTPRLKVIETPILNAYASGIREHHYAITVTRGLLRTLDDEELECVIAHELSHIRNRDVRLLVIAVIFVGIFSFFGETMVRGIMRTNLPRNDTHRRSGGGNAGALVLFGIVIVIIAYFLAILIRFSLSRRREFMADAGAVELTKNPDAMIRALKKISGHAEMGDVPAELREMAFENPRSGFMGLFATHPPIEKRIDALVKYGGGRVSV